VYNCAGIDHRKGYFIDMDKGHRVDTDGMYLNVDWKLAPGTLTLASGYRCAGLRACPSDYTGVVGPVSVFDANRSDIRKTYQTELRFASRDFGAFNYVAGAFYQHDNTKFCVAQVLGLLRPVLRSNPGRHRHQAASTTTRRSCATLRNRAHRPCTAN
jgi:iron complex outermembrane receptor protein